MSRVVPSQVVELIDKLFPAAENATPENNFGISREHSVAIAAILRLVEQLPPESLTVGATQFAEFQASIAALQTLIEQWISRDFGFDRVRGLRRLNPVVLIRQALAQCRDDFPAVATVGLEFIQDDGLKESLRRDLGASHSALNNGEWKAATVLSGSVIEALLLWALEQRPPGDVQLATNKLVGGTFKRPPPTSLDDWALSQYIEVAVELKLITANTAIAARLAKDFRNLIHPGRTKRLGQECNRATALSAVAALEHVVNDLSH